MSAWMVRAVELPFGDEVRTLWIDALGVVHQQPIPAAEALPGRFVLWGLVDSHAHPAIGVGPSGPVALDEHRAHDTLTGWADSGVALVRDVGSPLGLTLELTQRDGEPVIVAAGRFLAPEGRYFPDLLVEPVREEDLISAALAELRRGATWVKVIADFPHVPDFNDNAPTYPVPLIASLATAVHEAGGRVAVHT